MRLPTFSKIGRAMVCPASEILPRTSREVGAAAIAGKEDHEHLRRFLDDGTPAPFDLAPLVAWLKEDNGCAPVGELALAYDPDTEITLQLGYNIDREYEKHGADMRAQFCGALDACSFGLEKNPELEAQAKAEGKVGYATRVIARLADLKTGRADGDLWQLKAQAVALARLTNAEVVHACFWYIPRDGGPQTKQVFTWATMDLDGFAAEMAALKRELKAPARTMAQGASGAGLVNEGDHCTYCEAYAACPAKVALARVLGAEASAVGTVLGDEIATLTPAEAGLAWDRLVKAEALLKHVRAGLEGYARAVPLELADGRLVKAVPTSRELIIGIVALGALEQEFGLEIAHACCLPETSKTALKKVLGAAKLERALEVIGAAGGIAVSTSSTVKAVKA